MYHYTLITPPCPKCHSSNTYYVVPYSGMDAGQYEADAIRHGQFIKTSYGPREWNLTCKSCGFSWNGNMKRQFMTAKDLKEEYQKRNISNESIQALEDEYIYYAKNKKHDKTYLLRKARDSVTGYFRAQTNSLIEDFMGSIMPLADIGTKKEKKKK